MYLLLKVNSDLDASKIRYHTCEFVRKKIVVICNNELQKRYMRITYYNISSSYSIELKIEYIRIIIFFTTIYFTTAKKC